ncbi:MAG: hypothetical protein ACHQ49_06980 [Elusimicrobiota bacterium]
MKTPRLAFAVLLAAAAPALAQTSLTPITMGPPATGQCVVGTGSCGVPFGGTMDPVFEGSLVRLGQQAVPTLNTERGAPPVAAKTASDETPESATDIAALGGQIINPGAASSSFGRATSFGLGPSASVGARQSTFDTRIDATGTTPEPVAKAQNLGYYKSVKIEESLTGKEQSFGADPKMSAGDSDFTPSGTGASANH